MAELSELSRSAPEQAVRENMVKMRFLDELSILRNLELRFYKGQIYTYVGTVLISINPFQMLPLYTPDVLDKYTDDSSANPPHVFALADRSYKLLLETWHDQSVIVSGESGAGKTEATKVLLEYLMEMSRRAGGDKTFATSSTHSESLEELCIYAQTVLEAFGNAKTVRNDNSSRFGKWIEVFFNRAGTIQGAVINTYLLEKSRVVKPEDGERNYHVFYQLLGKAQQDPTLKETYSLHSPQHFHYLNQSQVTSIQGVCEIEEFDKLEEALEVFGVEAADRANLWKTLAAILHLGNIKFEKKQVKDDSNDQAGCAVANREEMFMAAKYLAVAPEVLEKALCFRSYGTRSITFIPYLPEEATLARDAFAKAIYAGLFNYLGQRINQCLRRPGCNSSNRTIGVLDIFGFEILQTNSFEQLCINFCNERLQSHFNEECFRIEQEEYREEGVEVDEVGYNDNQPCVDLLELRPSGIFPTIEEEINTPGGSEENWLGKLHQGPLKDSEYLVKVNPKEGINCFKINHYAGTVMYKTEGLLDKSKDSLHPDLEELMLHSDDHFLTLLKQARVEGPLQDRAPADSTTQKKKKAQPTLGTQFCLQLRALMDKLHATKPHFIKCLKPNMHKKGGLFVAEEILTQLQYTGIVGLCKIRQIGYPERMPLDEFYDRYKCIDPKQTTPEDLIMSMAEMCIMKPGLWVLGYTKLLMKHEQHNFVSEALIKVQIKSTILLQARLRGWLARRWFAKMKEIITAVRQAIQLRNKDLLIQAIDQMTKEMPLQGNHIPEKAEAKKLVARIEAEEKAEALVCEAILSSDIPQLMSAVQHCNQIAYTAPSLPQAQALLEKLQNEEKVKELLSQAIQAKDRDLLTAALEEAAKAGMEISLVRQAEALVARIDLEQELNQKYEESLAASDIDAIDQVLKAMTEAGMQLPENAKESLEELEARRQQEKALEEQLRLAKEAQDQSALNEALEQARAAGYEDVAVQEASQFLQSQDKKKSDMSALMAACKTLEIKMYSTGGIDPADLEVVHGCINSLVGYEFTAEENAQISDTQQILRKGMVVQQCTDKMRRALEARNYDDLYALCEQADKLQIKSNVVEQARIMLDEIEGEGPEIPCGTMSQILEISQNPRWRFDKYSRLRTREQFAKGKILNRRRCIETMFQSSKEAIPNSMIDLPTQTSKIAVNVNKCLLAFCGVRRTTYPAASALAILEKGKAVGSLRDEIFVQICKHLTENSDRKSMQRGWLLLCLCIELFSPSVEFELYLLNFVVNSMDNELWSEYAQFCLDRLEEELDMNEEALAQLVHQKEVPSTAYITSLLNGEISLFDENKTL